MTRISLLTGIYPTKSKKWENENTFLYALNVHICTIKHCNNLKGDGIVSDLSTYYCFDFIITRKGVRLRILLVCTGLLTNIIL